MLVNAIQDSHAAINFFHFFFATDRSIFTTARAMVNDPFYKDGLTSDIEGSLLRNAIQ